jgi:RNA polymerase sigma-70 factor (TIGR02943 family)
MSSTAPAESPAHAEAPPEGGFAPDLLRIHGQLMRFARAQVRTAALAEDAVSAAVVAALESRKRFATESQATAWMFGVLRHKLVDELRQQGREVPSGDMLDEGQAPPAWHDSSVWGDPELAYRQMQFIEVVSACFERLPSAHAVAFELRELEGLDTPTICERLGLSEGHLWVQLHRARRKLRAMLQQDWSLAPG